MAIITELPNKLSGGHYYGIPQLSRNVAKMPFPPNFPGLEKGTQSSPNFHKLLRTVWTLQSLWLHAHRTDSCGRGWGWCLTCHRMAWVLLASISDCNVEQKKPSTGSRTTLKLYICKYAMYNVQILLKWLAHNVKTIHLQTHHIQRLDITEVTGTQHWNCTFANTPHTTLFDITEVTATQCWN